MKGSSCRPTAARGADLIVKAVDASHRHDGEILFRLGLVHKNGYGGTVDPARAAELFREAYALGSTTAGNSLALGYLYGTGVPANPYRGIDLLKSLAQVGDEYAQANLARQYLYGIVVPCDAAAARGLYAAAAAWGDVAAECDRTVHQLDMTPLSVPASAP